MKLLHWMTMAKDDRIQELEAVLSEILEMPGLHCDARQCTYCGAELLDISGRDGNVGYRIDHDVHCRVSKWRRVLKND